MKRTLVGIGAAALAVAVPSMASAHNAVVTCNVNGTITVTPDYLQLDPVWIIGEGFVDVVWSDGFTRRVTIPAACVPPVIPTPEIIPEPAPPPPEVAESPPILVRISPPPAANPPTCAELLVLYPKAGAARRASWGCPAPVIKLPKPDKPKRTITKTYIACAGVGKWSKVIIKVTLPSGKTGRVVKRGIKCKLPKVTG